MANLIMRRGPKPGTVYPLKSDVVTIGSGMKNDVVIQDNDISREHCRLIRVGNHYELEDLNSAHGTFVAGQRVRERWPLRSGIIIEMGESVTLEFEQEGVMDEDLVRQRWTPTPAKSDPEAHPYLVLIAGPKPGTVYPLNLPTVRIGRDLSNDILIQDPEISRFHLRLKRGDLGYEVEDLNSTNGVLLNGTRITEPTPLHGNDIIQVGTMVEFCYTWKPDEIQIEKARKRLPNTPQSARLKTTETEGIDISALTNKTKKMQTSSLGTGLAAGDLVNHVYIAYARSEWETIAAPLAVVLQDAGIHTWADQYLIPGHEDWLAAIDQALAECWLLVLIISPEALDSRHVRQAYRYFFNRDKPVVPLLYLPMTDMPSELAHLQIIPYDAKNPQKSFERMVAEIKQRRG